LNTKKKGTFTFRTAAVLFALSALFEFISLGTEVPLFGAIHGGRVAMAYHLVYAALYIGLGIGFWSAKRWAYPAVFAATAVYTLDELQTMFLSRDVIVERLMQEIAGSPELLQVVNKESMLQMVLLVSATFIACWWGFVWYTHLRRDYFKPGAGHSS
jgi:hypothetical protein